MARQPWPGAVKHSLPCCLSVAKPALESLHGSTFFFTAGRKRRLSVAKPALGGLHGSKTRVLLMAESDVR